MVVAARLLTLGQFADLALVAALTGIAVQVADLGVAVQLPQAFASETSGMPVRAIRQAFLRRLAGSLVTAPILVAAFLTAASTGSLVVAVGFAVSTIATATYGAGYVALRSVDSYGLESALEPAGRVVVLALGAYGAATGHGLAWIAMSYALADVLILGIVGAAVARRCHGSTKGAPLGRVTWLLAAGPVGMVYWRADIWLLASLATSAQVALYGSSYRLLDAALLPALVAAQLFLAPFVRCPPHQRRAFVSRWVVGSVAMTLPFTLVAVAFGRPLLTLVFGPAFAGATASLTFLALAAPLTAAAFVLTAALASLDPRAYIILATMVLGLNLLGNLLLAPSFGAAGAASMTLLSQVVFVSAQWAMVRRRLTSASADATSLSFRP